MAHLQIEVLFNPSPRTAHDRNEENDAYTRGNVNRTLAPQSNPPFRTTVPMTPNYTSSMPPQAIHRWPRSARFRLTSTQSAAMVTHLNSTEMSTASGSVMTSAEQASPTKVLIPTAYSARFAFKFILYPESGYFIVSDTSTHHNSQSGQQQTAEGQAGKITFCVLRRINILCTPRVIDSR